MYFLYAVGAAFIGSAVFNAIKMMQKRAPSADEQRTATPLQQILASMDGSVGSDNTVAKESPYPSDWLTSNDHLALDRRAIFCKV
jgi:hypothetical protein